MSASTLPKHAVLLTLINKKSRILTILTIISVIAAGTIAFANLDSRDTYIKVSKNPDRSNSVPLDGSKVSGEVYIHLSDRSINSAMYFLNTNGNFKNEASYTSMSSYPHDFQYKKANGDARPFDTNLLAEGQHTLVVRVRDSKSGEYTKHTAIFTVDNVPDKAIDTRIRVSSSPDRSNDKPLDSATIKGNAYIFVESNDVNNVAWFLNTDGNYDNSVMTTGKRTAPYDFQYTKSNGEARPFDTTKLNDGVHELAATVQSKSTGKYDRSIVRFTVNNSSVTSTTVKPISTNPPVTTTQPTTPTPTPTTIPPFDSGNFKPKFPGDVAPGKVRWGSGGGNTDPVNRFGSTLGNRMGLRRTFVSNWNPSSVVSLARQDVNAGRLPWVSNKPAGSWKDHGDGKFDASTRQMFIDLGKLNGPVWYTFHHEPEGGGSAGNRPDDSGGPTQWLRAQERISRILRDLQSQGQARNVAFGPVLMGYTWQKSSGRDPNAWYKAGIWDFAGIDAYTRHESNSNPMESDGLPAARKFYGERGLKVALGEWAIRTQSTSETNAGEKPSAEEERIAGERMKLAYNTMLNSARDGKGAQIIGAAYFDTHLNSGAASYELTGTQYKVFCDIISMSTSIKANQN